MLTSSLHPDRADSTVGASVMVDELSGWAGVAEALLMDCARTTLIDIAEPAARQALTSAHAETLAQLVHEHLLSTAALQRREISSEVRRSDGLTAQLRTTLEECAEMGEQLVAERTSRAALEEELTCVSAELEAAQEEREALHSERAAVWNSVRVACLSAAHTHVGGLAPPTATTLEDHVRYLCDWVAKAEAELTRRTAAAPDPPSPPPPPSSNSVFASPRPVYRRILPSAPLNPVTASLLRVKEQVQQLREPSVTQLQQAVGAYRPLRDESLATTPVTRTRADSIHNTSTAAAAAAAVTPLPVDRSLGLSRSYTPQRSATSVLRSADGSVSSPRWRSHLSKLQEELKGLRRDLGNTTPQ